MRDNSRPLATGNPFPPPPPTTNRILFAAFLGVGGIGVAILFMVWFVIYPHPPIFYVSSLSLSNFNASFSPSLITGEWDVRLTAQNPNHKLTLHYYKINASVFYKNTLISQTTLSPFDQGTNNQTALKASFASVGGYVERWVVDDISKDISKGSVGFSVKLEMDVLFRALGFLRHLRQVTRCVKVYCRDLEVGLTSGAENASFVEKGERKCKVRGVD